jgi:hypothetical protein
LKPVVAALLGTVCLVLANPYITVINEFGAGDGANSWLELHLQPEDVAWDSWPLTGDVIRTSTSACTLNCWISMGQYIVIDSAALAQGVVAHGTFRLRPDSDFVSFGHSDRFVLEESICYPRTPTAREAAPAPPRGGSVAYWTLQGGDYQSCNWYVDSTPTPGMVNDDWSAIAGTLSADGVYEFSWLQVFARGPYGHCFALESYTNDYVVKGLGPGNYALEAWGGFDTARYRGFYPESVSVGYGRIRSGINILLGRYMGVADGALPPTPGIELRSAGRTVSAVLHAPTTVRLELSDLLGRQREVLHKGRLGTGVHRFEISSRVGAGVYFARLSTQFDKTTCKVVVMR